MATFSEKRKKVEALVYETLMRLEPSGMNAEKYKELFKSMTDKQFEEFFMKMYKNDNGNFYVEVDLYGKNQITMKSIEKAAKFLNVPLEEYVYIRHKSEDGTPVRTPFRVPVLYIHLKRMQQLLSKKAKTSVDIMNGGGRSRITGSLDSKHKSGRFTDADTTALISITSDTMVKDKVTGLEASPIVKEFLGSRGDNLMDKAIMQQNIALTGEVSQHEIDVTRRTVYQDYTLPVGQASEALDIFFKSAGLVTDINPIDKTKKKKVSQEIMGALGDELASSLTDE